MKENFEFTGRRYGDTEKEELEHTMQSWSEESLLPMDGELEKTEEEVLMLETINSFISDELEQLGIDTYEPISLERVHILPESVFKEKFPDSTAKAFFLSTSDVVYLNRDAVSTKAQIFSTLLHELIHRASIKKFYYDQDSRSISDARLGYRLNSSWKEEGRQNRLRGFNELMTDFTVYKLLLKNLQKLNIVLGITKEDIQGPIFSYMHYGPILESILKKISAEKSVPQGKVFEDLERGQFANNLLVLKDVERSFGRGAIEILSLLESLSDKEENQKLEQMIKDYFSEQNDELRDSLGAKIKEFVEISSTK
jgi:hypothetical protein